ncbi:hypothetical protein K491DRAFT_689253 [Lophiostoma macrostomum CBS 122681]|uniref:BZIP domain-containing protein n=1 Tax=Lophiostoma macrostomum CBS 122681 TaxID=1314788 RepID=A0A6A6TJ93_9PLEO|nr:hypothetical protein K491DRAFT_689253 [Lophiostoma macrostomum CBS 122681]
MKNFTFRQYRRSPKEDPKDSAPGDPKDKDNAAYLKRREQVRRAQRTHRERKEAYIKQLENEVLQLRTNEAKILTETRTLAFDIARFKKILDHHGIPHDHPSGYVTPPQTSGISPTGSTSSIGIFTNPLGQQQLHFPSLGSQHSGGTEFYLSESDGSQGAESHKAPRRKLSFFRSRDRSESGSNADSGGPAASTTDLSALSAPISNLSLGDMDQTNLGMEFVLSLEAPCLHHTQGDPHEPHTPTGHALTATAPLLFQAPTQPVPTTGTAHPPRWDTPHLGLEKLLELSQNIELEDELTPVQAWNQIRCHPDFDAVDVGGLRRLTEGMLKHVKCYGFGAVIETEVFGNLVGNLFQGGSGRAGLAVPAF